MPRNFDLLARLLSTAILHSGLGRSAVIVVFMEFGKPRLRD